MSLGSPIFHFINYPKLDAGCEGQALQLFTYLHGTSYQHLRQSTACVRWNFLLNIGTARKNVPNFGFIEPAPVTL